MSRLTPESQWVMEHHDTLDNARKSLGEGGIVSENSQPTLISNFI